MLKTSNPLQDFRANGNPAKIYFWIKKKRDEMAIFIFLKFQWPVVDRSTWTVYYAHLIEKTRHYDSNYHHWLKKKLEKKWNEIRKISVAYCRLIKYSRTEQKTLTDLSFLRIFVKNNRKMGKQFEWLTRCLKMANQSQLTLNKLLTWRMWTNSFCSMSKKLKQKFGSDEYTQCQTVTSFK